MVADARTARRARDVAAVGEDWLGDIPGPHQEDDHERRQDDGEPALRRSQPGDAAEANRGWQSGWRCIDLRGLNDERIAHEGYPDEKALADPNPDVNVAHVRTSPTASSIHAGSDGFLDGWTMGALSRLARVWVRGRRPADRVERCRSGCG